MKLYFRTGLIAGILLLLLGGCGEHYVFKPDDRESLSPSLPYDPPPTNIAEAMASFFNNRLQGGHVHFSPDFKFVRSLSMPPSDEIQFQKQKYELLGITQDQRIAGRYVFETSVIPRIRKRSGSQSDSNNMVVYSVFRVTSDGHGYIGVGSGNLGIEYFQPEKNTFIIKKISLVSASLVIYGNTSDYEPWVMVPIQRVKEFYAFMEQGDHAKAAVYVKNTPRFLEYNSSRILAPCHNLPLKAEFYFGKGGTLVSVVPYGLNYDVDSFLIFRTYYHQGWKPFDLVDYYWKYLTSEDDIREIDFIDHGLDTVVVLAPDIIHNIVSTFPTASDSQRLALYLTLSLSRDPAAIAFLSQWHGSLDTISPPPPLKYEHKTDRWGRFPPVYSFRENAGAIPWVLAVGNYFTMTLNDLILYRSSDTTSTDSAFIIPFIYNARSQVSSFTISNDTLRLSVHQDSGCISYGHWKCYSVAPETTLGYVLPFDSIRKDSDSDSLSDMVENRLYTNPYGKDTDQDGLDDRSDCSPQVSFKIHSGDTSGILQAAFDFIVHIESRSNYHSNIHRLPLTLYTDRSSYAGYPGWLLALDSAQSNDFHDRFGIGYFGKVELSSSLSSLKSDRAIVRFSIDNAEWQWDGYTVFLNKIDGQWFVVYYDASSIVQ